MIGAGSQIRFLIGRKSHTFTVERPTNELNELREVTESSTTHDVDILLYNSQDIEFETETGERVVCDLMGYVLPDADIAEDDKVLHNNRKYTVDAITNRPNDMAVEYKVLALTRDL